MDDLRAGLQKLGFSQYESRAYVTLLASPRITGYELAKQSGISQSKIYEVIDRLVQKELVVAIEEGGSLRYVPLDPKIAVDRYREDYTRVLDVVGERLTSLYDEEASGAAYVVSLQRAADIVAKTVEMIEAAQTEIMLMLWPDELPGVQTALRSAELRGVAIAICIYGEGDPGTGAVYHHPLDDYVRRNQRGRRMVLVIDRRESLVSHFSESGRATAHWSTNLGFVQMSEDYVRHDIWNVRMGEDFGPLARREVRAGAGAVARHLLASHRAPGRCRRRGGGVDDGPARAPGPSRARPGRRAARRLRSHVGRRVRRQRLSHPDGAARRPGDACPGHVRQPGGRQRSVAHGPRHRIRHPSRWSCSGRASSSSSPPASRRRSWAE